jgi:hypothetical protein
LKCCRDSKGVNKKLDTLPDLALGSDAIEQENTRAYKASPSYLAMAGGNRKAPERKNSPTAITPLQPRPGATG